MNKPTISVIGLGKLGAPIAAVWAAKGHTVYGVDVSERVIEMINAGEPPVQEPRLHEYLRLAQGRLAASKATAQAVIDSDVTFVLVPTPSDPETHRFVLDYVLPACAQIGQGIGAKDGYHIVVLTSTVMPGATEGPVLDALERSSGKKHGEGFGLVYSPEFVALGTVIRDFLSPNELLIGYRNERDRDTVSGLYLSVVENMPPVHAMDWWNAEVTKLALNGFMTSKISYGNFLLQLCAGHPRGNVDAITAALGADQRISPKYLSGALPYAGPCFPRDARALAALAQGMGVTTLIPDAIHLFNDNHHYHLHHLVWRALPSDRSTVGVLGLSYKPGTPVVEESPGMRLAEGLCMEAPEDYDLTVLGYDPMANDNARQAGIEGFYVVDSLEQCVAMSDVLVVTVPWPQFYELEHLPLEGKVLIDCWRVLDPELLSPGVRYIPYGLGKETR